MSVASGVARVEECRSALGEGGEVELRHGGAIGGSGSRWTESPVRDGDGTKKQHYASNGLW